MAESCTQSVLFGKGLDSFDASVSKFIVTERYYELVYEVLERAKDRQAIQYAKF